MQEKSYGIIAIDKKDFLQVLMVQHREGHWTFPKGRIEAFEAPKQCAERELKEEVALEIVRFLELPELKERYIFFRGKQKIDKEVTYFFAEVKGKIKLQLEEISDAKWVGLNKALELSTFEEAKNLVRKIQQMLKKE